MSWGNKILVAGGVVALALLLALSPQDEAVGWVVAFSGAGLLIFLLGLQSDERERFNTLRIFGVALVLRLAVTVLLYKLDLTEKSGLGGGDETLWKNMWNRSLTWNQVGDYPNTLTGVFEGMLHKKNHGYSSLGSYFYFLTDVKSQIALSALNCIIGALVVVLIYKSARAFWGEKGAVFAGWLATFAPSYLFWSAMSQKEVWVLLCVTFTLWTVSRYAQSKSPMDALLAFCGVMVSGTFRFYLVPLLGVSVLLSLVVWRATRRPGVVLAFVMTGGLITAGMLLGLHIVHFDIAGFVQDRLAEARDFAYSMAGRKSVGAGFGNHSGVVLAYDVRTPSGLAMTLLVGCTYVLFSPFPWQLSGRQFVVIPELLLYWGLMSVFVVPGVLHAWHTNRRVLFTAVLFLAPLIMLYSISFGNVFLTYRMRSQMMPFYFLLAAGGYEWHLRRLLHARFAGDPQTQARHLALERLRTTLRGPRALRQ